jgi:hypothetical protein
MKGCLCRSPFEVRLERLQQLLHFLIHLLTGQSGFRFRVGRWIPETIREFPQPGMSFSEILGIDPIGLHHPIHLHLQPP